MEHSFTVLHKMHSIILLHASWHRNNNLRQQLDALLNVTQVQGIVELRARILWGKKGSNDVSDVHVNHSQAQRARTHERTCTPLTDKNLSIQHTFRISAIFSIFRSFSVLPVTK